MKDRICSSCCQRNVDLSGNKFRFRNEMQEKTGCSAADAVIPVTSGAFLRDTGIDQCLIKLPISIEILLFSCYFIEFPINYSRSNRAMAEAQIENIVRLIDVRKINVRNDL